MSGINIEKAKNVYDVVCATLDEMGFRYEKVPEHLAIEFSYRGRDMHHDFEIIINAEQDAIMMMDYLPLRINPQKAAEVAMAVCYANKKTLAGRFLYGMEEYMIYALTHIYLDSVISKSTVERMILSVTTTVEEYDDKFSKLNNGYLKVDDFR